MNPLDQTAEQALKSGAIEGMVLPCFADERPLQGIIGELDWWLNQPFTQAIRKGVFSGAEGEKVYIPVQYLGQVFHFLVLGQGYSTDSGRTVLSPDRFIKEAIEWTKEFGFKKIGISRSELTMEGSFDIWTTQ